MQQVKKRLVITLGVTVALLSWGCAAPPGEDPTEKRVKKCIQILSHPQARGENLDATVAAIDELVAIGAPAVPALLEARLSGDRGLAVEAEIVLAKIGGPAKEPIRARWHAWSDDQRWKFMPLMEEIDREWVRDYGLNSLTSKDDDIRAKAWGFVIRHRDERAKERYLKALRGGESPAVRWKLLSPAVVFDEKVEEEVLRLLLRPDSWAAKGEKYPIPFTGEALWGWTGDGRVFVIESLQARQARAAAPDVLALLNEPEPRGPFCDVGMAVIQMVADLDYKPAREELRRVIDTPFVEKKGEPGEDQRREYHDKVKKLALDTLRKLDQ